MPFRLNSVVLTGATSGIGEEMAYRLAGQGAWLTIAGRDTEKLNAVAKRCRILGSHRRVRVLAITCDVTNDNQCRNLIDAAYHTHGRIDTLINNAGRMMAMPFTAGNSLDDYHRLMEVNYFGAVQCTQHALPYLKMSRGRIAAMSGMMGKIGAPTFAGYAASKFALTGFMESLRMELASSGVTVTILHPEKVQTSIYARSLNARRLADETNFVDREGLPVDECARRALRAIYHRRRDHMLTFGGRLTVWLKQLMPGFIESIIRGRTVRRAQEFMTALDRSGRSS